VEDVPAVNLGLVELPGAVQGVGDIQGRVAAVQVVLMVSCPY
jgi:hypothetical protein